MLGGNKMKHNDNIGCTVNECKNHCNDDNYCTLHKIEVTKHEAIASDCKCTDCSSFQK